MPPINVYHCEHCNEVLHEGWGGYQYVENERGQRICCPHPGEEYTICEVLCIAHDDYRQAFPLCAPAAPPGPSWWWSMSKKDAYLRDIKLREEKILSVRTLVESRTGYNSECICRKCMKKCDLDLGDQETAKESWRWYYKAIQPKDKRRCPNCGSQDINTVFELIGRACPFCKTGRIIEEETNVRS